MIKKRKKFKFGLPLQLITLVGVVLLLGNAMPLVFKQFAYALSVSLKEVLMFALPLVIFSFLFSCLLSFKEGVLTFVISLILAVCASNFLAVLLAYGVGSVALGSISASSTSTGMVLESLEPLWSFSFPKLIPNQYALALGLFAGIFFSYKKSPRAIAISQFLKNLSLKFLNSIFIPLVPVFVFGFLIKLDYDGLLVEALKTYGPITLLLVSVQCAYVLFLFGLATGFKPLAFWEALKNVFPSALTGFTTMSSAAAMPMTLQGAQANTKDPIMADAIVPATVNVHLLGDSIGFPLLAIATLLTFGHPFPEFSSYLVFAGYFIMTKFAVAAVPGGSILVLLPIIQTHLGFSGEMSSIMATFCILFDCFFTTANVTANGAFAMLFTRVYNLFFPKSHKREKSTLA